MIVFENHFDGHSTVIIKDRVINNCRDFSLEDRSSGIYRLYGVSQQFQDDVAGALDINDDSNILDFIAHPDPCVRGSIARHGDDTHRDILVNDGDQFVRAEVVIHGNQGHRDQLVDDVSVSVRRLIAQFGSDANRDQLINDFDGFVRGEVARFGNDGHRNSLRHDSDDFVKLAVIGFDPANPPQPCTPEEASMGMPQTMRP